MIPDGKVFVGDRCSEPMTSVKGERVDAWYSGKSSRHCGNVQAVMRPDGLPSGAAPQHITADPDRITEITRATLVLTQFEHKYISGKSVR